MQACESDVHTAVLESADLCPMKAGQIGKFILREAGRLPQFTDARAQPFLDLLPLHQEQIGGILLKRILLISRGPPRASLQRRIC